VDRSDQFDAPLLIAKEALMPGPRLAVRNPANPDEIVGTIVRGTPQQIETAIEAARNAQRSWSERSYMDRASYLGAALDNLRDGVDERAKLYVRENGKTLAEARRELTDIEPRARLTLELATELMGIRELPAPHGRTYITEVPFGVVVSIVPWNAPVSLACMQIVPALLAGNTVVVKAPESCPLALIRTVQKLAESLPAGTLNLVTGLPSEIGDALTLDPNVRKIGFTGSIPAARTILCNAAQSIKSVTCELGGNDPAIILSDADLSEDMLARMAGIIFRMTGQVCMAIKRIYVADAIYDRFIDGFCAVAGRIVVGDGLRPSVTMGPLHTSAGLERANSYVDDASRRGAKLRTVGSIEDRQAFDKGHFMLPTIVAEIDDDAPLVAQEQFCPAIPVLRYRSIEDALDRANATIFGLGGSVWGGDLDRARSIASQVQAGTVFVNTHGTNSVNRQAPYGGMKQSGNGRRAGIEGLREYLQLKTLTTHEA
jgi:acyl-CoA reductase-like NAD-dependent aldehyde dehydrogenase